MGETVRLGNPPIEIHLRRSARARRMTLRVSQLDGRVTLTLPKRVKVRDGVDFAAEREAWLRNHLEDIAPANGIEPGSLLPFEGRELPVRLGQGRAARITPDAIEVPRPDGAGPRIAAAFKLAARDRLTAASDRYAAALGRPYNRLTLRDTRSRWGSCTTTGNLMYSWRLIMAPPDVLDYVAAHEVAHLAEMNHSAAFWAEVARLCPDYSAPRTWLRMNGASLHRFNFA